jgi:hypothetical protein
MDAPPRHRRWVRSLVLPFALLPLTIGLAACGGGSSDGGVATLNGDATGDESGDEGATKELTEEERQQAMLDFAKCMREHGVDMPDPQFDDNGRGAMVIGGADGGPPPDESVMQAAQEACQPLMQDVIDSAPQDMDPEEIEKRQQEALDFAKCMREHGIDMPDPQFGGGGRMTQSMTADPNDPNFQAAQEACAGEGDGPGFTFGTGPASGGDE